VTVIDDMDGGYKSLRLKKHYTGTELVLPIYFVYTAGFQSLKYYNIPCTCIIYRCDIIGDQLDRRKRYIVMIILHLNKDISDL